MSKKAAATTLFNQMRISNPSVSRAEIIDAFCTHVGLTKAGASTYYQQIKKQAGGDVGATNQPQPTKRVSEEVHQRVVALSAECISKAEMAYKLKFKMPNIEYNFSGTTAGTARHSTWTTTYQADMMMQNLHNGFIEDTVPHEIAHLIDRQVNGIQYIGRSRKRSVHGQTWKNVMSVFGADPSRCHSYDIGNIIRKTKTKYTYTCGCGTDHQLVGPKVHKNIQMGRKYTCRTCKTHLEKDSAKVAGKITHQEFVDIRDNKKIG